MCRRRRHWCLGEGNGKRRRKQNKIVVLFGSKLRLNDEWFGGFVGGVSYYTGCNMCEER